MGWLSGYSKRKPITITGGASGAQTDFQLKLTVAYDGDMQSDFDDLRFTQADGETLIDAWLETKTDDTSATVWAEFPTTPANTVEQTYYMYYGKADAVSDWDGDATFPFFDDFAGVSIDGDKWDTIGTPVVNDGLTIDGSNDQVFSKTYMMGKDYALRTYSHFHNQNANVKWMGLVDSSWTAPWLVWLQNVGTMAAYSWINGSDYELDAITITDTYATFEMRVLDSDIRYLEDGVEKASATVGWTTQAEPVTFGAYAVGMINVDWVLTRKYVTNPPTYAFGSEESAPTSGNPHWYYNLLKRRNS